MALKITFTFRVAVARQILELTQYAAKRSNTSANTQAFLDALIQRAYQEMEEDKKADRKWHKCSLCGEIWTGRQNSCPKCGQWSA